ncbi:hypothetical protein B0T49_13880 [Chromobacterium violaceum]|uniref:hypothetical protein n=1 Tax=Chromobacterium violaceum TaxID=536 RepID=UPI0009DB64D4|nr:hypothetical protein [Chromobacterium violaceum]MBX9268160.1 hypothetical protein [Chromobacterium violaceum]OQS46768.1 hypothetical protein B0T48_15090 [Chromobacterium violaceum]OQS49414.1 hypothetical protein B0T49_13880 [Chromobacterium violaceum]
MRNEDDGRGRLAAAPIGRDAAGWRALRAVAPLPVSWRLGPEMAGLLPMTLQALREQALHPQLADWLGKQEEAGA